MKIGDIVRRTVPLPGVDKIYGVVLQIWSSGDRACEVLWPDGDITLPFKKNLEVVNESR